MRFESSNVFHGLAIAAVLLVAVSAAQAGELTVTDAWIRALPRSVPSGGYFTLHNGTGKPVTLTGADSPACGMLMLHKSGNTGGMGSMDHVAAVDIAPGGTLRFSPGGYHLMCMDAGPAIRAGAKVEIALQFKDGPDLKTQFAVRNAAGK